MSYGEIDLAFDQASTVVYRLIDKSRSISIDKILPLVEDFELCVGGGPEDISVYPSVL